MAQLNLIQIVIQSYFNIINIYERKMTNAGIEYINKIIEEMNNESSLLF